jgi:hypothetical protein
MHGVARRCCSSRRRRAEKLGGRASDVMGMPRRVGNALTALFANAEIVRMRGRSEPLLSQSGEDGPTFLPRPRRSAALGQHRLHQRVHFLIMPRHDDGVIRRGEVRDEVPPIPAM